MLKDDEIIAAYIREKKPELLDTLSFTIYKAVKPLADYLRKMSTVEIETALSDMEEMESEKENKMNDFMISRNTFLNALVLDADGKTDIIQVKLALEKAVVENEEEKQIMGICSSCSHRPLCRDVTPAMAKCSSFDPVFNAIKTAVDRYGADAQKKVFFGEVGELMTAIADTDRGRDNVEHITEELADVVVCAKQIMYIYGIKQSALLTAVHNKTTRLAHRLAEEDASVRNSSILDEVPSIVDALEMCSSDKCSDKCRYYGRPECCGGLMEDAAVLIEELSARNGDGSK